jgi:ABC-2 type transport system permease protein
MNIYLFELKAIRKNTIIWAITLSALCVLFMSIFPSYASNAEEVKTMLKGFPPEVLSAFALDVDSIFSVLGFYTFTLTYLLFCGAVQAGNLGIGLISRENRAKTADFLLTKPIKRETVLTAKLLASLTSIAFTNIVYLAVSTAVCIAVKNAAFDVKALWLLSLTLFFIQLTFVCIGTLCGIVFHRVKSVVTTSLCLAFAFFAVSMLNSFIDKDVLRYITPYQYFDSVAIIKNLAYEPTSLLTVLVVCTACIFASYWLYIKTDVRAV